MKNSRILSNLAKDVLHLYSYTHDRRLENVFLRLAQSFEEILSSWLKNSAKMSELRKKMGNPTILDAILLLQKIKSENPSGISKNDLLTRYFVSTNNDRLIPFMKGFVPLLAHPEVSDILASYANLIQMFDVFQITRSESPSALVGDLNIILNDFRTYMSALVNEPYEEEPIHKTQKFNKKQKKEGLLNYLTFKFGEEVAQAFDKIGRQDISNVIRIGEGSPAGDSLLLDPRAIYALFPKMVGYPLALERNARILTKDALGDIEPSSYEKNYNNIRNSILTSSGIITYEQEQEYKYNQMVNRGKSVATDQPMQSIPVDAMKWIYPSPAALQVLSLFLFSLNARINK